MRMFVEQRADVMQVSGVHLEDVREASGVCIEGMCARVMMHV